MEAGITNFFTITMKDIHENLLTSSVATTKIEIMATYLDHDQYPSPIGIADLTDWQSTYGQNIAGIALDNGDGTYAAQITIYKAGRFTLNIRVNTLDIKNSPFRTIEVSPTNVYGPSCI